MVSNQPREAFTQIRIQLEQAGIEDAAFDAGCLLELVAGSNWRWNDDVLSEEQCSRLTELAQKRAERYPLQYLVEHWSFLDFTLEVGPGVLIPRADTEVLCEVSQQLMQGVVAPQVLDLCAGSGCVGLGVKRLLPTAQVTCLEKSPQAFCYLKKNAESALKQMNKPNMTVTPVEGDVFTYQNTLPTNSLDLIVSNPPYITHQEMETLEPELAFEPVMALEAEQEGLAFYQHIAPAYMFAIKPGGWLAVEIGCNQGDAVKEIFLRAGYQKVKVYQDYGANDRVVVGQKPDETV